MARTKSFTSLNIAQLDPLEFDLDGTTFHCLPAMPGVTLLTFAGAAGSGDAAGGEMAVALLNFLADSIVEGEREKFTAFIADPDRGVDVATLMEIAEFLMEQYMGDIPLSPEGPSSDS